MPPRAPRVLRERASHLLPLCANVGDQDGGAAPARSTPTFASCSRLGPPALLRLLPARDDAREHPNQVHAMGSALPEPNSLTKNFRLLLAGDDDLEKCMRLAAAP